MYNDTNNKDTDKKVFAKRPKSMSRGKPKHQKKEDEFDQKVLDLARVTRVTAGGKRMRFRACIILGDKKGSVGIGIAKGSDVSGAINKAVSQAKKQMIDLSKYKGVVPHEVESKFGAARIYLKPGKAGNGIIAGGVVRDVLEISGFKDAVAKMYGSKSKINNAKAVMKAFSSFIAINKENKQHGSNSSEGESTPPGTSASGVK